MNENDFFKLLASSEGTQQSYVFVGDDPAEIESGAKKFASGLNISDFDIVEIRPEISENGKGEYKVKAIRELIRQINLTPNRSSKKMAIIYEADKLNIESANTLLKTLEEPPPSAIIVLLSKRNKLLSTIQSRCQIVRFKNIGQNDSELASDLSELKGEKLKKYFDLAQKISSSENIDAEFESILLHYQKNLKTGDLVAANKIKKIFLAKKAMAKTNNKKLVLENLFLEICYE